MSWFYFYLLPLLSILSWRSNFPHVFNLYLCLLHLSESYQRVVVYSPLYTYSLLDHHYSYKILLLIVGHLIRVLGCILHCLLLWCLLYQSIHPLDYRLPFLFYYELNFLFYDVSFSWSWVVAGWFFYCFQSIFSYSTSDIDMVSFSCFIYHPTSIVTDNLSIVFYVDCLSVEFLWTCSHMSSFFLF